jgi:hypothetical protein
MNITLVFLIGLALILLVNRSSNIEGADVPQEWVNKTRHEWGCSDCPTFIDYNDNLAVERVSNCSDIAHKVKILWRAPGKSDELLVANKFGHGADLWMEKAACEVNGCNFEKNFWGNKCVDK